MKKVYFAILACLMMAFTVGCDDDNKHTPEAEATQLQYDGKSTSSIPIFSTFVPQSSDNYAIVNWLNNNKTAIDLEMGEFSVDVEEVQMHIEIGKMQIKGIPCTKTGTDKYEFTLDDFTCMAGAYNTKGNITGTINGKAIEFTILYKPGSMPFDVKTVFTGTLSE